MASAAELAILLSLKDEASKNLEGFRGKLGALGGIAKGVGIGIAAVGTAAIGAGVASVKQFAEAGDEIAKMAVKTGFSTEALSELKYAADLSGASLSTIQVAVRGMANFLDLARSGSAETARAMADLGLSMEDIQGLSPEQTFAKFSEAIAGIEDPLTRAAAAQNIFGRSGMELLPMLAGGKEGLDQMRQEARDLGLVFDEAGAKGAEKFNDDLTRLQGAFTGLMNQVATAVMPAMGPLIETFTELVKALPIGEITSLITGLLPPLVKLLLDLMKAIPVDVMVKFVTAALVPMMQILLALMPILVPILDLFGKLMALLTPVIELLGKALEKVAKLMGFGLGKLVGGLASLVPEIGGKGKEPKGFASGGIVTSPTLAMIGERGPEAVIPLGAGALGAQVVQIQLFLDGEQITEVVERRMDRRARIQQPV